MIAIKTLIGGSVLVMAVGALPVMAYAGDMGEDYHHGDGMESYHHGHGDMGFHHDHRDMGDHMHGGKGHIMQGHIRVDVYIHKAGEEKHKKYEGEHMRSHWDHACHGGWEHEKFSKMHGHHGDWDHSRYGYEGRGGRDYDHYDKASERHGHWDAEQYGEESGGDRDDYPDDGGGD